MKDVQFETDEIPTYCHILITDNDGKLIHQMKVRTSRDYSQETMVEKGLEYLLRLMQRGEIEFKN
jgi:hypothetical protein